MGQAFLSSRPKIQNFSYVVPGWLVDLYAPGMVFQKTLNLYRKFQFIGNFEVKFEDGNSYQDLCYGWKTMCFSSVRAGKCRFLSETLSRISSIAQWTPYQLLYACIIMVKGDQLVAF